MRKELGNEEIEKNKLSDENMMKLYLEARSDYRNSLNMEQTILNFCVAVLTMCIATGFIMFTQITSWIIFAIIIPFFLSLVKFVYIHQKHRSKTYKVYINRIEKVIETRSNDFIGFEMWKSENVSSFVNHRIGFKFAYSVFFFGISYLFMIIGFISFQKISTTLFLVFIVVLSINILIDIIGLKYIKAINKLVND